MLRGNYLATVDEKGRVKIPADFLAELRKTRQEVLRHQRERRSRHDLSHESVGRDREEARETFLAQPAPNRKFLARTNYYGQVVEVDGQGRILIPPVLRESAEMKGEVDVQGQLTYLEVWNHARFLEQMNRNPMTAEDEKALDELGI